ncbi:MAG: hypothetical protein HYW86_01620 [Candidatus Roizmanbacteria bacterium]|nr:MAG: hypothetical protein HYW86_01620 [Candidatus Roizmanbacteria bacterium]
MFKFIRFLLITIFSFLTLIALTQKVFAGQKIFSWFETKTKKMSVNPPIKIFGTEVKSEHDLTPAPTSVPTVTPIIPINPPVTPTLQPTIAPTAVPTAAPTSSPSVSIDDPIGYIMNAINDYRRSKGLSSVSPDPNTCNLARIRSGEIVDNFNHENFYNMGNNNTLPYPSYSQVTENLAMIDDYKKVVDLWINSPTHAENMQKDTPYVCVASNGYYYAYEGWRP